MPSNKDKPHVGARVSTKRRVIAGVEHSDTGTITRLEDGGYCVVRWDSDGESTSVLMMSLRPLADNSYSEGFDDAAQVARVLNSVADTSAETTITVTEADRAALKKCPKGWFDWTHDAVILIRCPRYRLDRLAERGLLEWKSKETFGRIYRLTKQGREAQK